MTIQYHEKNTVFLFISERVYALLRLLWLWKTAIKLKRDKTKWVFVAFYLFCLRITKIGVHCLHFHFIECVNNGILSKKERKVALYFKKILVWQLTGQNQDDDRTKSVFSLRYDAFGNLTQKHVFQNKQKFLGKSFAWITLKIHGWGLVTVFIKGYLETFFLGLGLYANEMRFQMNSWLF